MNNFWEIVVESFAIENIAGTILVLVAIGLVTLWKKARNRNATIEENKKTTDQLGTGLKEAVQASREADEKSRAEFKAEMLAMRTDFKEAVQALEKADEKSRAEFRAEMEKSRTEFKEEMRDISNKFTESFTLAVQGIVPSIMGALQKHSEAEKSGTPAHGESPLVLTEYGLKLSDAMDAEIIAQSYTSRMYEETQGMNAYQIQLHCHIFASSTMMDELEKYNRIIFDRISDVAFNENTNFWQTGMVIGLLLRDAVFELRGMNVPVRKVIEADAGVKAEAEAEADAKSGE